MAAAPFSTLVLSGGALRTIAFLGVAKYLQARGYLEGVRTYAGSSGGAIVAFMLCLGFDWIRMRNDIVQHFVRSPPQLQLHQLRTVFQQYGLDSGADVLAIFERTLQLCGLARGTTMSELRRATGRTLIVCGANITRGEAEYFCADRTPDMPVALALRISMSVPVIYQPVRHNGDMYVDGCLYDHFPLNALQGTGRHHAGGCGQQDTLGVCIAPGTARPDSGFLPYVMRLIETSTMRAASARSATPWIMHLSVDDHVQLFNVGNLNYSALTEAQVEAFVACGYEQAERYFRERQMPLPRRASRLLPAGA
jgi:predicted acylesterase/phospholipase RssA